jgi:hypothetical protein
MLLSDFIKDLQIMYDNYGDAEVYSSRGIFEVVGVQALLDVEGQVIKVLCVTGE